MIADFRRLNQATTHPTDAVAKVRAKALATAQQFEDVMVRTFVSAMRETTKVTPDAEGMFGSGPGSDTFSDWFDEKLAHEVSSSGKVGVASVLMAEFERSRQIPADPDAATKAQHAADPTRRRAHLPSSLIDTRPPHLQPLHLPTAGGIDVAV